MRSIKPPHAAPGEPPPHAPPAGMLPAAVLPAGAGDGRHEVHPALPSHGAASVAAAAITAPPGLGRQMAAALLALALLLGTAHLFLVTGFGVASASLPVWRNPGGDLSQSLLGAEAFLRDPAWRLPLAATGRLLADGHALSIVYTDSVPWVTIAAKAAGLDAADVNPIGLALCLGFVLQPAAFALLLIAGGVRRGEVVAFGAVLGSLLPAWYMRTTGHVALSSHWIILLALALAVRAIRTEVSAAVVAGLCATGALSLGLHAYLFAVVAVVAAGGLWADVARSGVPGAARTELPQTELPPRGLAALPRASAGTGAFLAVSAAAAWLLGYGAGGGGVGGFGMYSMNLLSPVMPQVSALRALVAGGPGQIIDATGGQYEGYNYLGAGVLLVLAAGLSVLAAAGLTPAASGPDRSGRPGVLPPMPQAGDPARGTIPGTPLLKEAGPGGLPLADPRFQDVGQSPGLACLGSPDSKALGASPGSARTAASVSRGAARPLLLGLAGLGMLAVSNHVYLGTTQVLSLPLVARPLLDELRSSGRLFWPVAYALLAGALAALDRWRGRRTMALVLVAAAAMQVHDTSLLRAATRAAYARAPAARDPALDPWRAGPLAGRDVRVLPRFLCARPADMEVVRALSLAALRAGGTVEGGPSARVRGGACTDDEFAAAAAPDKKERVDVLLRASLPARTLAIASQARDCVPLGFGLACGAGVAQALGDAAPPATPDPPERLAAGERVGFAAEGGAGLRGPGWSSAGDLGSWTTGRRSLLVLPLGADWRGDAVVEVEASAFAPPPRAGQEVAVSVGGQPVAHWTVPAGRFVRREARVPRALWRSTLLMTLEVPGALSPRKVGRSPDRRTLGIVVREVLATEGGP